MNWMLSEAIEQLSRAERITGSSSA